MWSEFSAHFWKWVFAIQISPPWTGCVNLVTFYRDILFLYPVAQWPCATADFTFCFRQSNERSLLWSEFSAHFYKWIFVIYIGSLWINCINFVTFYRDTKFLQPFAQGPILHSVFSEKSERSLVWSEFSAHFWKWVFAIQISPPWTGCVNFVTFYRDIMFLYPVAQRPCATADF